MLSTAVRQAIESVRPLLDRDLISEITRRLDHLPKRKASLGRFEDLVVHYGLILGTPDPRIEHKGLVIFCADHGVALEGVSEDTQDQTRDVMKQMVRGGTAAAVLCQQARIETLVVNVGVRGPDVPGATSLVVAQGSANLSKGPAMTAEQVNAAMEAGLTVAAECALRFDIVGTGVIGVGASTAAAAMLAAFSGREASETASRSPGLDDSAYQRKLQCIRDGLAANQQVSLTPLGILRALGGIDIAALTGFLLGAAARRLPVVLDDFTTCAAALAARALAPDSLDAMVFSSRSPDANHALMLRFLAVEPVIEIGSREGGGFCAALGISLVETALRLYREIRAFEPR